MEPFAAEAAVETAPSSMPPVSIDDLAAAGTNLRRGEAVAVVRAICRAILDSPEQATDAELNTKHAFINSDGTVSLTSRPHAETALHGVRHLLLQVLPPNEFVVAKALPDASLEEFYEALEFYVASDPVQAIKDIRRKWRPARAPVVAAASPEQPIDAAAKPSGVLSRFGWLRFERLRSYWRRLDRFRFSRLRSHRLRFDWLKFDRRRPIPLLVAGAILFATSAGLLALTLKNRHVTASMLASAFESSSPAASVEPAPASGAPSPSPSRPAGHSKASAPAAQPLSKTGTAPRTAHVEPSRARPSTASGRTSSKAIDEAPLPTAPFKGSAGLVGSSLTLSKPEAPSGSTVSKLDPADVAPPTTVYDASHRDIVPPQFIYPLLPGPLPAVPASSEAPAIEVTINEQGTIDSVKASIPPRTIAEAVKMLGELSAAKAWRFRPASRSGSPVKYRLVVPLTFF